MSKPPNVGGEVARELPNANRFRYRIEPASVSQHHVYHSFDSVVIVTDAEMLRKRCLCGYITVGLGSDVWGEDAGGHGQRARTNADRRLRRPIATVPPLSPLTVSEQPRYFPIGFRLGIAFDIVFWHNDTFVMAVSNEVTPKML